MFSEAFEPPLNQSRVMFQSDIDRAITAAAIDQKAWPANPSRFLNTEGSWCASLSVIMTTASFGR
jgi:hypothetical protein